jgi:hypothetical protein
MIDYKLYVNGWINRLYVLLMPETSFWVNDLSFSAYKFNKAVSFENTKNYEIDLIDSTFFDNSPFSSPK